MLIVTGICILAPLSLPIIVKVAYNAVWVPNNVLTPVADRFKVVPITVCETLVPFVTAVTDAFNWLAAAVSIPVAWKPENNLASEIVNV